MKEYLKLLQEKIKDLSLDNPKVSRALERLNQGDEINPKMKKLLEEAAFNLYEVEKYGLSEDELFKTEDKEILIAYIKHLEKKLNIVVECLEIIATTNPDKKDCFIMANQVLEQISLRKIKK